jgi:transposase InsO family protein
VAGASVGCGSSTSVAEPSSGRLFSPRGRWSQVPPADVQADVRAAFARWGLPERFRVDNGVPWGSRGDLPTDLALWLIGLGVAVDWNPPRRPQDNGVVERSQGTGKRWAEPGACDTLEELQGRLEEMDDIQRQEYPSLGGRSRLATYPALAHSGRTYALACEEEAWDLATVAAHLSLYVVRRHVDTKGMASLYGRNHYVGVIHKGKDVHVMFDPVILGWVVVDAEGRELRHWAAPEISRERIVGLQVTHRRKGTDRQNTDDQ